MKGRLAFLSLVSILLLILAPFALAHTIWYVDGVHGNDGNDCKTRQTACKTIGHAISLASPEDTIGVGPATYTENLTINKYLKVTGSGPSTTIIDGGGVDTVIKVMIEPFGDVQLYGLTIRNGGKSGIENYAALVINRCTISGNTVGGGGAGGGVYSDGGLTISNSTIVGNSATGGGYGGGVANLAGKVQIINSTVTNNSAEFGGGIANQGDGGEVSFFSSTISENTASSGGGVYNSGFMLGPLKNDGGFMQNSIVANNTGQNCSGSIGSGGYNLSSDNSCNLSGPGDMNNTDPMLGPLKNNGGPTQTQALLSGSPAIDAGNPSGCTDGGNLLKTDQRGMPRPDKEDTGGCDMGAYERQSD